MTGKLLPKTTNNETIGLRLSSTQEDNEKWIKGQKFAAKVFAAAGFALIFNGIVFEGITCGIILFCMLGIMVLALILGSAVNT